MYPVSPESEQFAAQRHSDALALRMQALALLKQAQAIDGLKPFALAHEHRGGTSVYLCWANMQPTEEEACEVLSAFGNEFEPEREEVITVEDELTIEQIAGVDPNARVADLLERATSAHRADDRAREAGQRA